MPATLLTISLCCNDDHGNTTDRVAQIHISDSAFELCIELDSLYVDWFPKLAFLSGAIRISGKRFVCTGRQHWVGNIFWEAVRMTPTEVCRLLNWARARDLFRMDAAPSVIFDAWDDGREITEAMLTE